MNFAKTSVLTAALVVACSGDALAAATEAPLPPPRPKIEVKEKSSIERFCEMTAPSVAELRIAAQRRELEALDKKIVEQIVALNRLAREAEEWIAKRDKLASKADKDVVAIYAKSDPESAAKQLDEMQDDAAVAILRRLSPQLASSILGEMNATRASRIVSAMRGAAPDGEKGP